MVAQWLGVLSSYRKVPSSIKIKSLIPSFGMHDKTYIPDVLTAPTPTGVTSPRSTLANKVPECHLASLGPVPSSLVHAVTQLDEVYGPSERCTIGLGRRRVVGY
ncbi:hypothetical protein EVAR_96749_1 [Eumeta japonica]|uniref:Uncharacterized protein n=1 Tax=Eumeta variegata TaxID=151549 RepID=A0A4C1Y4B0_EUMVA|nr:hypothetical protein EVAR_96749_1 [Eumeta japonica]